MRLWSVWWDLVRQLRPAFGRSRTFLWFAAALAAAALRGGDSIKLALIALAIAWVAGAATSPGRSPWPRACP